MGSKEKKTVNEMAKLICEIMKMEPEFKYTGTPRGWVGDVKLMLLDASKLEALGWKQKLSFEEGFRRYLKWLS